MASSRTALSCPGCTARLFTATLDLYAGKKGSSSMLRQYPSTRRTFSTTRVRLAQGAIPTQRRPAMPSVRVAIAAEQEAAMKRGLPRGGVGLSKDFIIIPSWMSLLVTRKVSGTIDFRSTWKAISTYLKYVIQVHATSLYTWWKNRKHKPTITFDRRKTPLIAEALHRRVFQAFAAGTLTMEKDSVCEGLYNTLQKRIRQRRPGGILEWQITQVIEKPKLFAYRAMPLQTDQDESTTATAKNFQLQAVVRLHTEQKLQRFINETARQSSKKRDITTTAAATTTTKVPLDAQPTTKQSVELAVINKTIKDGVASDWMLWGFTQESNLQDMYDSEQSKKDQAVYEAVQEYKKQRGAS